MSLYRSVSNCLGIKFRVPLSRKKYDAIRHSLSASWDEGEGNYKWNSFNGVYFPKLVSRYAIDNRVVEVKRIYGWQLFSEGTSYLFAFNYVLVVLPPSLDNIQRVFYCVSIT